MLHVLVLIPYGWTSCAWSTPSMPPGWGGNVWTIASLLRLLITHDHWQSYHNASGEHDSTHAASPPLPADIFKSCIGIAAS